jgi:16S rRNA (guanine1516-N2)-methyltransferase
MREDSAARFRLESTDGGLVLVRGGDRKGVALESRDLSRRLKQGRRLLLARACDARDGVSVLDAMAGLGLDGLTLARLGCTVTLCERHPMVHDLLRDGAVRLAPELVGTGAITIVHADASDLLRSGARYDVVYFDPMFPPRSKSALPSKRSAYLADLVGCSGPLAPLIELARECARLRVVVKRRRHDAPVIEPDFQLIGRSVRFDVYRAAAPGQRQR